MNKDLIKGTLIGLFTGILTMMILVEKFGTIDSVTIDGEEFQYYDSFQYDEETAVTVYFKNK